jgi:hypothetical protein
MGSERSRQLLIGAVAVALLFTTYRIWPRTSTAASPASNQVRAASRARPRADAPLTAPDVRLEELSAEKAKPEAGERNLFRFKPKPPPPPPPAPRVVEAAPRPVPAGPPPPPPVPPITLKFIGIIDRGGQKIAVLSDSAGHVDYGSEGAIIGGRYRVLKIGVESIEMAHLDGRGRQTIRLTGS